MIYGLSSLFSFLLFGSNTLSTYNANPLFLISEFYRFCSGFIYWLFGHICGVEYFYQAHDAHPEYIRDFTQYAQGQGFLTFQQFLPVLLGLIASIIVVWGSVRLIVKVCSLGKITY